MNKLFLYNILWVLLFQICYACKNVNSKNNYNHSKTNKIEIIQKANNLRFDSLIYKIDKQVIDLTSPSDLFSILEFKNIYENPLIYIDSVVVYLKKPECTFQQKLISIYSMQNLDFKNYLIFCDKAIEQFNSYSIEENIIISIINPNFANKYPIIKNYNKQEVIEILKKIDGGSKRRKELNDLIINISNGKLWNNIKQFKENSGQ